MATIQETQRYWVPKGTVLHIAGFPVQVTEDTSFMTHKENWALISAAIQFPKLSPIDVAPARGNT